MANNHSSRLPDTPWHIGYAIKAENDPRRHKNKCIHLDEDLCTCLMVRCTGSSHCKFYAESQKQWEEYLEEMKTEDEKALDRAMLYRLEKRRYVRTLLERGDYVKKYRFFPGMINCPFCHERMKKLKCNYCFAKFKVVDVISETAIEQARQDGYFLIKST